MKTETWNIERLTPYARNPRKNDAAVDKVAASIKEFGFRQAIVVDAEGVIIAGHTRYKAAKKLGMKQVPVHVADGLTPQQVKAYRIADNKVGELAEWDDELLALEIEELKMDDYPIELTGFCDIEPIDRADGDCAGASPWDRVGRASDGIMFSFGQIQARLPEKMHDMLVKALTDTNIMDWLNEHLNN